MGGECLDKRARLISTQGPLPLLHGYVVATYPTHMRPPNLLFILKMRDPFHLSKFKKKISSAVAGCPRYRVPPLRASCDGDDNPFRSPLCVVSLRSVRAIIPWRQRGASPAIASPACPRKLRVVSLTASLVHRGRASVSMHRSCWRCGRSVLGCVSARRASSHAWRRRRPGCAQARDARTRGAAEAAWSGSVASPCVV